DGVPDHGTMLLLDPPAEPGLVAVVFESATGGVLARGPAGTPLHLGALDRRDVSVAAIDAAGNLSPILAVRRGLWVATLGDKVPNSALENPHRGVLHSALPASLGDEGLEVGAELAGADGITATSSAMPRWHAGPQGEATSLPRYLPAYAWDDA